MIVADTARPYGADVGSQNPCFSTGSVSTPRLCMAIETHFFRYVHGCTSDGTPEKDYDHEARSEIAIVASLSHGERGQAYQSLTQIYVRPMLPTG